MKHIGLVLLLLSLSVKCISQGTIPTTLQQVIPSPPSVRDMETYTNYDVGLQNGVASFSIPIYTINIGKISYPIVLTYHTSGVKYTTRVNDVGEGWTLSPLYETSRTVYGRPDEFYPMLSNIDLSNLTFPTPYGKDQFLSSFVTRGHGTDQDIPFPPNEPYYNDGEYDMFNYNIGNSSGSFIVSDRANRQIKQIVQNTNKITYQTNSPNFNGGNNYIGGISYFKITDGNGITYEMGNKNPLEETFLAKTTGGDGTAANTTWYVSSITDPLGNQININYQAGSETEANTSETFYSQAAFVSPQGEYSFPVHSSTMLGEPSHGNEYDVRQINNISTRNENVVFYREDPYANSGRIDSIVIYDQNNHVIRRVLFHYASLAGCGNSLLDTLTVKGPDETSSQKYGFRYYPGSTSLGRDYWGYFSDNGVQETDFPLFDDIILTYGDGMGFETPTYLQTKINRRDLSPSLSSPSNYYSLQRIDFPTGGYREYEYEFNQYIGYSEADAKSETKYMGIRVKRISSYDGIDGSPTLIHDYKYGIGENGLASVREDMARSQWFVKEGVMLERSVGSYLPTDTVAQSVYLGGEPSYTYQTTNPYLGYFNMMGGVFYPQVTVYQSSIGSDGTTSYNGKTENYFNRANSSGFINGLTVNMYSLSNNNPINGISVRRYPRYYVPAIDLWDIPYMSEVRKYDHSGSVYRLVQDDRYAYTLKGYSTAKALHVEKFCSAIIDGFPNAAFANANYYRNGINSFFEYANYNVNCGINLMTQKVSTVYNPSVPSDSIATTTDYAYNGSFQNSSVSTTDSKGGRRTEEFTYPLDYAGINASSTDAATMGIYNLVNKNVVNNAVEHASYVTGSNNQKSLLSSVMDQYRTDMPLPLQTIKVFTSTPLTDFQKSGVSGGLVQKDSRYAALLQFSGYDGYGNILEQQKANDVKEVYLWGYSGKYPVAKITGSDFGTVKAHVDTSVLNNGTETQVEAQLSALRSYFAATPSVQVTTCTYAPLVGMVSQTGPNGNTGYYSYDGLDRLQVVTDRDQNVVRRAFYNYAGQAKDYLGRQNYYNSARSAVFNRNNCGVGGTGSAATYMVAAGKYSSTVSQADADQKAQNEINASAQAYANANGTCTFLNTAKSAVFTRNTCAPGGTNASSSVTYTVAAGKYTSTVSQADADQKAQNEVNGSGQAYANANGGCALYASSLHSGTFTRNNCGYGYAGGCGDLQRGRRKVHVLPKPGGCRAESPERRKRKRTELRQHERQLHTVLLPVGSLGVRLPQHAAGDIGELRYRSGILRIRHRLRRHF